MSHKRNKIKKTKIPKKHQRTNHTTTTSNTNSTTNKKMMMSSYDLARAMRCAMNNIHVFATGLGAERDDVAYLDHQYKNLENILKFYKNKIRMGIEQLVGSSHDYITIDDNFILLSHAKIDIDDHSINRIIEQSLQYANKNNINTTSSNNTNNNNDDDDYSNSYIHTDTWLRGVLRYLRHHFMTCILGERRGQSSSSSSSFLDSIAIANMTNGGPKAFALNNNTSRYNNTTSNDRKDVLFGDSVVSISRSRSQEGKRSHHHHHNNIIGSKTLNPIGIKHSITMNGSITTTTTKKSIKRLVKLNPDDAFGHKKSKTLEMGGGIDIYATVEQLKRELREAQQGVLVLNEMVDENLQWVHTNCEVNSSSISISSRTKIKCKSMSAERMIKVFHGYLGNSMRYALNKWKEVNTFSIVNRNATIFSKAKSIEILTKVMYDIVCKQYLLAWIPWMKKVNHLKNMERDAAAIEIQKVVLGFLGKIKFHRKRLGKDAIKIQCMYRKFKSRRIVRAKRKQILNIKRNKAARVIQKLTKDFVVCRKAKRFVHNKRRNKAAIKIQKVHRGKVGKARHRRIKEEVIRKNKEYEEMLAQKERERLEALEQERLMLEKERKEREAKDVVGQFGGGVGTGAKKMDPEEKARLKAAEKAEKEAKKAAEKAEKEAEKARLKAEKEEKARLEKLEKEEKKRIADEEKAEKARQAQILKEEAERIKALEKAQKEKEKEDRAREKAEQAATAAAAKAAPPVDPEQAAAAAKIQSIVRAKEARNEIEALKEEKKKTRPNVKGSFNFGDADDNSKKSEEAPSSKESTDVNNEAQQAPAPAPTPSRKFSMFSSPAPAPAPAPVPTPAPNEIENNSAKVTSKPSTPDENKSSKGGMFGFSSKRSTTPEEKPVATPAEASKPSTPTDSSKPSTPETSKPTSSERKSSMFGGFGMGRESTPLETIPQAQDESLRIVDSPSVSTKDNERPPTSDARPPSSDGRRPPSTDGRPPSSDGRPPSSDARPPSSDGRPPSAGVDNDSQITKIKENVPSSKDASSPIDRPNTSSSERPGTASTRPSTGSSLLRKFSSFSGMGNATVESPTKPETPIREGVQESEPNAAADRPSSAAKMMKSFSSFNILGNNATPDRTSTPNTTGRGMIGSMLGISGKMMSTLSGSPSAPTGGKKPKGKAFFSKPLPPADVAIETIQRAVRVRQAIKRVKKKRDIKIKFQKRAGDWIRWAVISIQRIARARQGRKRFAAHKFAVETEIAGKKLHLAGFVNRIVRGFLARKRVLKRLREIEEEKRLAKFAQYQKGGRRPKKQAAQTDGDDDGDDASVKAMIKSQKKELDEKLKKIEDIHKALEEKEKAMQEAQRVAEERAAEMQRVLKQLEEREKAAAAEAEAQKAMMMMAAGPMGTGRSAMASSGPRTPKSARQTARASARGSYSSRIPDAPPTARSAREGGGIPPDAPKMEHDGETWVQLWDPDEKAMYWYCERTQAAQWETPGEEDTYSVGGMTDYSTDYSYESGGEYTDSEYGDTTEWQEFWDESAQAKYWYNYNTGEASWTRPTTRSMSRPDSFMSTNTMSSSYSAMPASALNPATSNDWIAYVDEGTGQEYWYNAKTGETSWK